jgi:predicted HTH domain antitoxin
LLEKVDVQSQEWQDAVKERQKKLTKEEKKEYKLLNYEIFLRFHVSFTKVVELLN